MQRYNIAKEGYIFIAFFLIVYMASFLLGIEILSFLDLVLLSYVAYFFREPEIKKSFSKNSIISPAQGKVVSIDDIVEDEFLNKKMKRISIFLSIFDVHVNYAPYDGVVKKRKYKKGEFRNAMNNESSNVNERLSILLETEKGSIVVRQIAGLIARRVVCYAKEGDILKKGKRYGIIKFGSRVDIFLPENVKIKVEIGNKVLAGLTEIAEFI